MVKRNHKWYWFSSFKSYNSSWYKARVYKYANLLFFIYFLLIFYFNRNILLHDGIVKIGDFGSAKNIETSDAYTDNIATLKYMSPEMEKKRTDSTINIDFKTDIWLILI